MLLQFIAIIFISILIDGDAGRQLSNSVSTRTIHARGNMSNFIYQQAIEKEKKQLYNTTQRNEKHRQTFVHTA